MDGVCVCVGEGGLVCGRGVAVTLCGGSDRDVLDNQNQCVQMCQVETAVTV